MIEMALGKYPYPPETYSNVFAQLTAIVHGDPPDLPEDKYSDTARDFVARCLRKDPDQRATYGELLVRAPMTSPQSMMSSHLFFSLHAGAPVPCARGRQRRGHGRVGAGRPRFQCTGSRRPAAAALRLGPHRPSYRYIPPVDRYPSRPRRPVRASAASAVSMRRRMRTPRSHPLIPPPWRSCRT